MERAQIEQRNVGMYEQQWEIVDAYSAAHGLSTAATLRVIVTEWKERRRGVRRLTTVARRLYVEQNSKTGEYGDSRHMTDAEAEQLNLDRNEAATMAGAGTSCWLWVPVSETGGGPYIAEGAAQ